MISRAKLVRVSHNHYEESLWPNNLLYIFRLVILGTIA
jgi:hypothetical protein